MELAPEDQDKLAQLFGGKLGGTPGMFQQAAAGLSPGNQGAPPPAQLAPIPGMPGSTAGPAAPPPTDDPRLQAKTSPMPGTAAAPRLPVPPAFQAPNLDRMNQLDQQITAASAPVTRAANPPKWYQRVLAPVVAAGTGWNEGPDKGAAAGRAILDRNYTRAQQAQADTLKPLEAEFERQGKIEPYIRDVNENKQRTFQNEDAAYKNLNAHQDREAGIKERGEAAAEATKVKQQNEDRREQEDAVTAAPGTRPQLTMVNGKPQLTQKTKSGATIPYVPKNIEEGAMLGDPTSRALFDRMHRDVNDAKPATRGEFAKVQVTLDQGWAKAKREYDTAMEHVPTRTKENGARVDAMTRSAQRDYYDARQEAQDAYERELTGLGGKADHVELPRNHFGEGGGVQPAAAAPAAAQPSPTNTASAPKVGDKISIKGKQMTVTKLYPNGRFDAN